MKIAVLALQGDFAEHEKMLTAAGIDYLELRQASDLKQEYDGLILPGGESTAQGKLLRDLGMFEPLKKQIAEGLPVLATCAGMILLAEKLVNDDRKHFAVLPVSVRRNAYGRQLGSFRTYGKVGKLQKVPMTFIRAPYIENVQPGAAVLAKVDEHIVAVRYKNQVALSFHPELDDDSRIYESFLQNVVEPWRSKN